MPIMIADITIRITSAVGHQEVRVAGSVMPLLPTTPFWASHGMKSVNWFTLLRGKYAIPIASAVGVRISRPVRAQGHLEFYSGHDGCSRATVPKVVKRVAPQ